MPSLWTCLRLVDNDVLRSSFIWILCICWELRHRIHTRLGDMAPQRGIGTPSALIWVSNCCRNISSYKIITWHKIPYGWRSLWISSPLSNRFKGFRLQVGSLKLRRWTIYQEQSMLIEAWEWYLVAPRVK